jgi:hypothetical protein
VSELQVARQLGLRTAGVVTTPQTRKSDGNATHRPSGRGLMVGAADEPRAIVVGGVGEYNMRPADGGVGHWYVLRRGKVQGRATRLRDDRFVKGSVET